MIIFQKHKQVVILSKGDAESTEVLDRIKLMYDELPEFLKPGIQEDNKHTLKLKTGSTIKSRPSLILSGLLYTPLSLQGAELSYFLRSMVSVIGIMKYIRKL